MRKTVGLAVAAVVLRRLRSADATARGRHPGAHLDRIGPVPQGPARDDRDPARVLQLPAATYTASAYSFRHWESPLFG